MSWLCEYFWILMHQSLCKWLLLCVHQTRAWQTDEYWVWLKVIEDYNFLTLSFRMWRDLMKWCWKRLWYALLRALKNLDLLSARWSALDVSLSKQAKVSAISVTLSCPMRQDTGIDSMNRYCIQIMSCHVTFRVELERLGAVIFRLYRQGARICCQRDDVMTRFSYKVEAVQGTADTRPDRKE